MADKKLNEVTKVTDMAYVPVIMADGSIGQIAKADLASVVAGMMNTNKLFPFMTMRLLSEYGYTSLDEVDKPGMYVIPDAVSLYGDFSNGFLNVFVPYEGIVIQEGCRVTENAYYKRIRALDGNWLPWQRIDNFGYNSLAELAGGVANELGYKPNVLIPYSSNSPVLYRLCRIKTSASESSRFGGVFYITEYRTENSDMTVGIVSINSGVSINSIVAVTKLVGYKDGFLYRDDNYLYVYLSTAYRGAAISYVMVKEGALTPESVSGINVDSLTKLL